MPPANRRRSRHCHFFAIDTAGDYGIIIMNIPCAAACTGHEGAENNNMPAIKTENLTKSYGKKRGIIDVSLEVDEGAVMGFIGPNGAGKSTTIRTLLGLLFPTSGSASVLGMDSVKDNTRILESVGYLPPETAFYSGMRVHEVIELSARLRKRDCAEEAKRLCDRLELDTKRRVGELSLGNKKKVGIVCAMQHRPRLYLLDEPTSGLDPLIRQQFFELLAERNAEGATVLLSSHVLSDISKHCTHAAVIREGRLIKQGRIEELVGAGGKRVVLKGVKNAAELERIGGVHSIEVNGDDTAFVFAGSAKELITALAGIDFEDAAIGGRELDEVFMGYYSDGEA